MTSPNRRTTVLGFRKIPNRYAGIVLAFLLSLLMTCIVSFVSTARGVGLIPGFAKIWLQAWGLSWTVAFPVLLGVLPIVRRATAKIVEDP